MDTKTQDVFKIAEFGSRILDIIETQSKNDGSEMTQSDLQGAVDAVIMQAISYGRTGK